MFLQNGKTFKSLVRVIILEGFLPLFSSIFSSFFINFLCFFWNPPWNDFWEFFLIFLIKIVFLTTHWRPKGVPKSTLGATLSAQNLTFDLAAFAPERFFLIDLVRGRPPTKSIKKMTKSINERPPKRPNRSNKAPPRDQIDQKNDTRGANL